MEQGTGITLRGSGLLIEREDARIVHPEGPLPQHIGESD
jgi:hypothetical protein